jgi:hypothetical protein
LVKINNYYATSSDEFEEAEGTFEVFTFNETNIVGPSKHLWDENYYFGVIAVDKPGASSEYDEQVSLIAYRGSAMVLFPEAD